MLSAEHRIESMIEITERLSDLLEEETGLLKQMKVTKITSLQDAKLRLTDAYQARVEEINKNSDKYKNVTPILKQKLAQASKRFQEAIIKDINALNAAKLINTRVVEAIAAAALDQQQVVKGYNAKGSLEKAKTSTSAPKPTTMSETL